jgi:hypothetical protein
MENQIEIWKDVIGYDGVYKVSNLGNVMSLKRSRVKKDRLIIPVLTLGYYYVCLRNFKNKEKIKRLRVNRIVAIAFIPNPLNKEQVNHINGIKTDNRVENLEWCTPKENTIHSWKIGTSTMTEENKKKFIELGEKYKIKKKVLNKKTGEIYNSISLAAKCNNFKMQTLSAILNNQNRNNTDLVFYEIN